MTADPDRTQYQVQKENFDWGRYAVKKFEDKVFRVKIFSGDYPDDLFEELGTVFVKDGDKSAVYYLKSYYDIFLLEIENKTDLPQDFSIPRIQFIGQECKDQFATPWSLPNDVYRLNPKGITKNVYNGIVVLGLAVALAAISYSIPNILMGASSSKDKKETELTKVEPTEKEKKFYWSSLFHETKYQYNDLISQTNRIEPNSKKIGLLFLAKDSFDKCRDSLILQVE